VVDDDPDVRRFLVEFLRSSGYRVAEAADGPTGLTLLDREVPDLLILDFAMPGMTGAEVAAEARRSCPDLPIIFISGYSDTVALERAIGEVPLLRKPFRPGELVAALERALSERRLQ